MLSYSNSFDVLIILLSFLTCSCSSSNTVSALTKSFKKMCLCADAILRRLRPMLLTGVSAQKPGGTGALMPLLCSTQGAKIRKKV